MKQALLSFFFLYWFESKMKEKLIKFLCILLRNNEILIYVRQVN